MKTDARSSVTTPRRLSRRDQRVRVQAVALPSASQHSLRIAHVIHLLEVVKRWDVGPAELLAGSGVTEAMFEDPRATLPVPTMVGILERARELTREPALGLHIGLHTRATLYGSLGFAVVSAATIREAIDVSIRFGSIVTTAVTVRFRHDRRTASLIVDEHADFGTARDIVLLTTLVALWQVSVSLTRRELTTSTAEFAFPEPAYADRLGIAGLRMRFGRPVHQLTFDARSLDLPYTMPNPVALKLAAEQCQRELRSLGLEGDVVARVRGLVLRPDGGPRSLDEVAAVLRLSPRTLKRQLGARGASFSAIRDAQLRERALLLLRAPELSLAEVATRLGYATLAGFERAFQRWTDSTPATCRRAMSAPVGEDRC
jgi:AraC-like DNA-binding protein